MAQYSLSLLMPYFHEMHKKTYYGEVVSVRYHVTPPKLLNASGLNGDCTEAYRANSMLASTSQYVILTTYNYAMVNNNFYFC
jgi:hypothetical protein